MADGDLVTYNGEPTRRGDAEYLESVQSCTHYRGHGGLFPRVRLGEENGMRLYHESRPWRRCCRAAAGQLHEPLCEGEECPRCGQQVMSCDCDFMTEDAVPGA